MPNTIKRCTQITPTVEFTTLYDDDSIDTGLWNTGWGVVAQGAFKAGLPTPIAVTATGQMITNPLVVTMVSGRRYRIVCQLRAVVGSTAAVTLRMLPFDGGSSKSTDWGDLYCNAVTTAGAFDSLESGFIVEGDGASHSIEIQILCNTGATASAYWNQNCRFYVEDIGPVTRGSTGAVPADWTAADLRYVNTGGDTLTGMLLLPATVPTDPNHATNKAYVDTKVLPDNMLYDVVPVANRWVTPGGTETTVAINQGYPVFMPVRCPPCSINGIGFYLTTTTPANVRVGIYKTHPTLVQPYERFVDAGLVATGGTAGWKSASLTPVSWPGGLMWLAINANDGNGTVTACSGFGEPWVMFDVAQVPPSLGYRQWTTLMGSIAFVANLPATMGLSGGGNPKIAFKTS